MSMSKNKGSKELGHNFNSSLHPTPCTLHLTPYTLVALGSLSELETQVLIANRLEYLIKPTDLLDNIVHIRKLLNGLIFYVKKGISKNE